MDSGGESEQRRILIVEDDHDVAQLVAELLTHDAGCLVSIAESGATAAGEALTFDPHVILLDLMMPGVDGWQVAAQLQANSRTRSIPIVVMSAAHKVRERAQEIGAPFHLAKPFNLVDVLRVVEKALDTVGVIG